jgi:glycolate oxidase iron-sulfur subunit
MKMAGEGAAAITPQWVEHFDTCLGCMSCMTACPSGVDYSKLIEATRAQIERHHVRSLGEKLHRWLIFNTFPRPDRLRILRPFLAFYQNSGLQALVRILLPARLRSMEALLPKLGKRVQVPAVTPAEGEKRRRVGLVLGCVQREFLSEVNAATARVLAADGCEVAAPASQPCCGALLIHAGQEQPAVELAKRMIDEFEAAGVDAIISNAGGCGSHLKEYGHLLRDEPQYAERARQFSAKCRDVSEFLAELGPRAVRHPIAMRIAYQDSCHLQHAQQVRSQPRALLAAIPGLKIDELPESAICCGSAGIYNLIEPKTADELGDRKAGHITSIRPDAVATGNPGCLLQLRAALNRKGDKTPVLHTIQIVDASIRSTPVLE